MVDRHRRTIERSRRERNLAAGEINGLLAEMCRVTSAAGPRARAAIKSRLLRLIDRKAAASTRIALARSALRSHG